MEKMLKIMRGFFFTILFPLIIYIVMYIITHIKGVTIFGMNVNMWRTVLVNTAKSSVAALALWTQIKNGRFDFSGGATMVLSAIIAGNLVLSHQWGAGMLLLLCIVISMLLSAGTALIYIYGRVPIMICTIGVALLYESFTYLVFNAQGLNILSNTKLTTYGRLPGILVVLAIALAVFLVYSYLTVPGKRSKILANNQQVGVNIGINEKRNIIQTFLMCGVLLGCAAAIHGSTTMVAPQSGLDTANTLFANIIPAYMGMFVGAASIDALGVLFASMGMAILNYGLSCIKLGAGGSQQIILGCFMLGFYALMAQKDRLKAQFGKKQDQEAAA